MSMQPVVHTRQNALPNQILRLRPALQPLLQTILAHVPLEFLLLRLQGRRDGGVGEYVTCVCMSVLNITKKIS